MNHRLAKWTVAALLLTGVADAAPGKRFSLGNKVVPTSDTNMMRHCSVARIEPESFVLATGETTILDVYTVRCSKGGVRAPKGGEFVSIGGVGLRHAHLRNLAKPALVPSEH